MEKFETVRAYRPLQERAWVQEITYAARELIGEEVLDFQDEVLAGNELITLDPTEIISAVPNYRLLARLSCEDLVEAARENAPRSYEHDCSPRLVRMVDVRSVDALDGKKRVLTVATSRNLILAREKLAMREVAEQEIAHGLGWGSLKTQIRLATLDPDSYVGPHTLRKLSKHVPKRAKVGKGEIEPATIEASSYRIAA